MYRVVSMVVITNTMDANGDFGTGVGDIVYISPDGQSLTNGVPDAQIMATMDLGLGLSKLGYLHIPPNKTFIPTTAQLISNKAQGRSVAFAIQSKSCSSDLWNTLFRSGFIDTGNLDLSAIPKQEGGDDGYDMRIICAQGDGTGSLDDTNIAINGIMY